MASQRPEDWWQEYGGLFIAIVLALVCIPLPLIRLGCVLTTAARTPRSGLPEPMRSARAVDPAKLVEAGHDSIMVSPGSRGSTRFVMAVGDNGFSSVPGYCGRWGWRAVSVGTRGALRSSFHGTANEVGGAWWGDCIVWSTDSSNGTRRSPDAPVVTFNLPLLLAAHKHKAINLKVTLDVVYARKAFGNRGKLCFRNRSKCFTRELVLYLVTAAEWQARRNETDAELSLSRLAPVVAALVVGVLALRFAMLDIRLRSARRESQALQARRKQGKE